MRPDMMRKDELIEALRDRDNARHKNAVLWCLAIIGAIAAIAAIAYAVYRYMTPDYLEDFEDEFEEEDELALEEELVEDEEDIFVDEGEI
jgi:hypothetical protein